MGDKKTKGGGVFETAADVAKRRGVSCWCVWRIIRRGRIQPARLFGSVRAYDAAAVRAIEAELNRIREERPHLYQAAGELVGAA